MADVENGEFLWLSVNNDCERGVAMGSTRTYADLVEEMESLRQVFDASSDGVLITSLSDGRFKDMNAVAIELCGYTRGELEGNSTVATNMWLRSEDRRDFVAELKACGACGNREYFFQRRDGTRFPAQISARVVTLRGEAHIVSIIRDLTERKAAEELLREKDELHRSILLASPDDITITDLEGRLLIVSEAAHRVFGYPRGFDYSKMTIADFIAPEDMPKARETIRSMHMGTYIGPNYYRGVRGDGSHFDIEVNSGLIYGAGKKPVKMVFIARDVTERKQAEQRILELIRQLEEEKAHAQSIAMTDSLTGLPNRRAFDEALHMEFSRFTRSGVAFSLILLDIDCFKNYNDRNGHLAGDDCLRKVAACLKATVGRLPDIAARYGGEEFVVLLPDTSAPGAEAVARKIIQSFSGLALPHSTSSAAPYVTASLGLTTAVRGAVDTAEQVVELADRALYRAKAGGRNRFEVATCEKYG